MGNADGGVFHADVVRVFSIARALALSMLQTAWRCAIAQTAMGPLLVVVCAPLTDLSPCVKQVLKPTYPQAFIS